MKKFQFKQKRHFVTAVCLLVGLMVLTTSVYANYDNANGYSNYKSAVKNLLLSTDNVTIDGEFGFYLDGELMGAAEMGGKFAKNGASTYEKETDKDGLVSYERQTFSGKDSYVSYNPQNNTYYSYENRSYEMSSGNFLGVDMDDEMSQRLIRFMELSADLVVGDLKNNVVLTSEDESSLEYSIAVSRNQMPEIINAGLSLIFGSMNQSYDNRGGIYYEDWMASFDAFAEKEFGVDFNHDPWTDEGEFDVEASGYDTEEEYWDAYDEIQNAQWEYYDSIYEDYGHEGVVYVKADNSYDYYETYEEYSKAVYSSDIDEYDMYLMFGNEPYIENAKMTAKISKSGELLGNSIEVTLAGYDKNGEKHTATFKGEATLKDYGTTTPDVFDPEGKEQE